MKIPVYRNKRKVRRGQITSGLAVLAIALVAFLLVFNLGNKAWGQSTELPHPDWLKLNWILSPSNVTGIDTAPVNLDGYELFAVAAPSLTETGNKAGGLVPIEQRVKGIEKTLQRIADSNFNPQTLKVITRIDSRSGLPIILIDDQYLMTVTTLDAELQGTEPARLAEQLTQIIQTALIRSQQEHQSSFLVNQALISGGIILLLIAGSRGLSHWQKHLNARQIEIESQIYDRGKFPTFDELQPPNNQQQLSFNYLQRLLLQLVRLGLFGVGIFFILGLFPHTRALQPFILSTPLKLLAIGLGTYLLIRSSHVLIDHSSGAWRSNASPNASQRLSLRIATVSQVLKNITAVVWVGVGALSCLSVIGVDLIPLLAGAGLVGLAVSFAAQGLIKDVINGFLILIEDQYAVGDVIVVDRVSGLVEKMNLRITQLRNSEGRLITIPNSAISIVENLSKDWSRVDLAIDVDYQADPDMVLAVLNQLAEEMYREPTWRVNILEPPEVLGIDKIEHGGMQVRVWIKTKPLQQWLVAREFRRRLRLAMEREGIAVGIPQQSLGFQSPLELRKKAQLPREEKSMNPNLSGD